MEVVPPIHCHSPYGPHLQRSLLIPLAAATAEMYCLLPPGAARVPFTGKTLLQIIPIPPLPLQRKRLVVAALIISVPVKVHTIAGGPINDRQCLPAAESYSTGRTESRVRAQAPAR